jgi:hypothetical protein
VYVLASLPELSEQHIEITQVIRRTESWDSFRIDWPAVHLCVTDEPELTLLCMNFFGRILAATSSGFSEEEVDPSSAGPQHRGDLRDIRVIGRHVYVAGMGRQVYRRESPDNWCRIDEDILVPASEATILGFNSIDGLDETSIYAVGWAGEIWRFDGQEWEQQASPTNLKLERVVCVAPNTAYMCGQNGVLLRAVEDSIEVIDHGVTDLQFWGMAWFQDTLFVATESAVYKLCPDDTLKQVEFGLNKEPITSGWLHSCSDLMWSVGGEHLFSTIDGKRWKLEVVP